MQARRHLSPRIFVARSKTERRSLERSADGNERARNETAKIPLATTQPGAPHLRALGECVGSLPPGKMPNMITTFTHTDPNLLPVLEELKRREPIFHTLEFGASRADFEKSPAPDYWEVSASGRRYSREFILSELEKHPPVDAASVGWLSHDHALRQLGSDTYLITYTLRQLERITRRATIWQRSSEGWRILYHQGTIVSAEEDDAYPANWLDSPPWRETSERKHKG